MKLLAVCGQGLGSSLILGLNIKEVVKKLGVKGVDVNHSDLGGVTHGMADYIICGKDIAMAMEKYSNVICLDSILSKKELTEKITVIMKEHDLL